MEEISAALHTLAMAQASFGHNYFFKNNYLFREWTDTGSILDYAHRFVAVCEEKQGPADVEEVLDATHALMEHGVFRYHRRPELILRELEVCRQRIAEE